MEPVLALTRSLIERPSVTPDDAGCQALISARLAERGFRCEALPFGDVDNLLAVHGDSGPLFVFLGHTDVVPSGPTDAWTSPPFEPTEREGRLYGRGAADMKGSVAAFVVALERFVDRYPDHPGRVGLLVTSDEEGIAVDGVRKVVPLLEERGDHIDYCLVGEPSSTERLGDIVRIGRRGSLNLAITVRGIQGHVAYAQLAENPIHRALPALARLAGRSWDEGDTHFPATGFQISNLNAGTGASNVIPGTASVRCNFRYNPQHTPEALIAAVRAELDADGLAYDLETEDSGRPFITGSGALPTAVDEACREILGIAPDMNTGGGTSDGRFVAPTGSEVVELGPVNASIHKIDEWVEVSALPALADVYLRIMERTMEGNANA
ncbi:MAG: succinyl-diaminopimelate desuccinylase [Pseudomonadota bacterium]